MQAQNVNPLESDPRAARAGGALFRAQCATCHGADAKGIQGIDAPDLSSLWAIGDNTDASVFGTIRNGVPGSIMPPHTFPDAEVWMLVSFLKSIGGGTASASLTGNAEQGAELFAANCARCHRVNGDGGSLGPDLSVITARRSKEALISSIRSPSSTLTNRYRPVSLVTQDNRRIQGTVKSEDAFSIQVMDTNQNLRGFNKADLQQITHESQSLMPEFGSNLLSDSNLEDILGFLDSQRRNSRN
jgi:putative heme-binding domain-containing protein